MPRLADLAEGLKLPVDAIFNKMTVNEGRGYKHGKRF
jgi:hypothetical protein